MRIRRAKSPYIQGVVIDDTHPNIRKGQIVEIVKEEGEFYKVRVYLTGALDTIEKKYISLN